MSRTICFYANTSIDSLVGAAAIYCNVSSSSDKIAPIQFVPVGYEKSLFEGFDLMGVSEVYIIGLQPSFRDMLTLVEKKIDTTLFCHFSTMRRHWEELQAMLAESERDYLQWVSMPYSAGYTAWRHVRGLIIPKVVECVSHYTTGVVNDSTTNHIVEGMKYYGEDVEIIANVLRHPNSYEMVKQIGSTVYASKLQQAMEIINLGTDIISLKDADNHYKASFINVPTSLTTIVLNELLQTYRIAIGYWVEKESIVFNLRTNDDNIDVSALAKRCGGGGNKKSAGFKVGIGAEKKLVPSPHRLIETLLGS